MRQLRFNTFGIILKNVIINDDIEVLVGVALVETLRVRDTRNAEEHFVWAKTLEALVSKTQYITNMIEELVYKVLLLNARERIANIKAKDLVGLRKHRLLHLNAAGIVRRRRTKLKLASAAIGDVAARTPIGRGVAHGVHDGRHGG